MEQGVLIKKLVKGSRIVMMRGALRDEQLYGDQVVNIVSAVIKAVVLTFFISTVLEHTALPPFVSGAHAALIALPVFLSNPGGFFWRNLFAEKADAAAEYMRDWLTEKSKTESRLSPLDWGVDCKGEPIFAPKSTVESPNE